MEEGRQYHLNKITFSGVKLFRTPDTLMKPLFQMAEGDVFSTAKLRKGFENLRKLYGEFGYIDAVTEPTFDIIPNTDKIDLTLTAEEGKQFFVRRIDFAGNTTTRDKVIRREILLDEGDIFNSRLWELSLLRLNQLGYFEVLKEREAADIKRNTQIEHGRHHAQSQGARQELHRPDRRRFGHRRAASWDSTIPPTTSSGLGETLSLESQLGTRMRDVSLGFTEPYFLDRPLQLGFVVYLREVQLRSGPRSVDSVRPEPDPAVQSARHQQPAQLRAEQPRIHTFRQLSAAPQLCPPRPHLRLRHFRHHREERRGDAVFRVPVLPAHRRAERAQRHQDQPHHAVLHLQHGQPSHQSYRRAEPVHLAAEFAGSILGGNVNTVRPTIDAKYFRPSPLEQEARAGVPRHELAADRLRRKGGAALQPHLHRRRAGRSRIRNLGHQPGGFVPSSTSVNILNEDGTQRLQKTIVNGVVTQNSGARRTSRTTSSFSPAAICSSSGTSSTALTIVGPVTLAPFMDFGINKIALPGQLRMNPDRVDSLNGLFPQAGFTGKAVIAPGTQTPRMSTGIELQVLLPVVNAPFRIYWAYNPMICQGYLQPPIVADRSSFPNNATFLNAIVGMHDAGLRPGHAILRKALHLPLHHRPHILSMLVSKDT